MGISIEIETVLLMGFAMSHTAWGIRMSGRVDRLLELSEALNYYGIRIEGLWEKRLFKKLFETVSRC
jgi:hypothetical protein